MRNPTLVAAVWPTSTMSLAARRRSSLAAIAGAAIAIHLTCYSEHIRSSSSSLLQAGALVNKTLPSLVNGVVLIEARADAAGKQVLASPPVPPTVLTPPQPAAEGSAELLARAEQAMPQPVPSADHTAAAPTRAERLAAALPLAMQFSAALPIKAGPGLPPSPVAIADKPSAVPTQSEKAVPDLTAVETLAGAVPVSPPFAAAKHTRVPVWEDTSALVAKLPNVTFTGLTREAAEAVLSQRLDVNLGYFGKCGNEHRGVKNFGKCCWHSPPRDLVRGGFVVVRPVLERLVSEFCWMRTKELFQTYKKEYGCREVWPYTCEMFNDWLAAALAKYKKDPFFPDCHMIPQWCFASKGLAPSSCEHHIGEAERR